MCFYGFLKTVKGWASSNVKRALFQTLGAATENDISPYIFSLNAGMVSRCWSDDQSWWEGTYWVNSSDRYWGGMPCRHWYVKRSILNWILHNLQSMSRQYPSLIKPIPYNLYSLCPIVISSLLPMSRQYPSLKPMPMSKVKPYSIYVTHIRTFLSNSIYCILYLPYLRRYGAFLIIWLLTYLSNLKERPLLKFDYNYRMPIPNFLYLIPIYSNSLSPVFDEFIGFILINWPLSYPFDLKERS